jgi:hypothetical protein
MWLDSATRASPTAGRAIVDDPDRRARMRVLGAAHRSILVCTLSQRVPDVKQRRLLVSDVVMSARVSTRHATRFRRRCVARSAPRRCDVTRVDRRLSQPGFAAQHGSQPTGCAVRPRCRPRLPRSIPGNASGAARPDRRTWARRCSARAAPARRPSCRNRWPTLPRRIRVAARRSQEPSEAVRGMRLGAGRLTRRTPGALLRPPQGPTHVRSPH